MKYLAYFIVAVVLFSTTAFPQDYRRFRVSTGMGLIANNYFLPGFLWHIEPSLRLHNNFILGLRIETLVRPHGDIEVMGSYSLNGHYYFTDGAARFFGGLGFGIFIPNGGPGASCTCEDEPKIIGVPGFYPRFGLEYDHMAFTLEYNAVQSVKQIRYFDSPQMTGAPIYFNAQPSYFSVKFSFIIGGGKKKKAPGTTP